MNDNGENKFHDRMSELVRGMHAKGITPYGSEQCIYTQQKLQLSMASMALREKGHKETADYMDTEMARIDAIPGMQTDIYAYLQALADQLQLCLSIWNYCKKHDDLADVIPYVMYNLKSPFGTS